MYKRQDLGSIASNLKGVVNNLKQAMIQAIKIAMFKTNKPRLRCYNCENRGHLARNCRERLKSFRPTSLRGEHAKGGKHGNVDVLSRRPHKQDCEQLRIECSDDWPKEQRKDPMLAKIISAKEQNSRPSRNEIVHKAA